MEREPQTHSAQFDPPFCPACASMLVMEGRAFYNPPNTALETVVSFTRHPGTQPPNSPVVDSASECLIIDLHFRDSQEH